MPDIQLPRRREGDPQPPWRCPQCGHHARLLGVRFVPYPPAWSKDTHVRAVDRCAGCGYEYGRPATPAEWERLGLGEKPSHQARSPGDTGPLVGTGRRPSQEAPDTEPGIAGRWREEEEDREVAPARDRPGSGSHEPGWLVPVVGLAIGAILAWVNWWRPRRPDGGQRR